MKHWRIEQVAWDRFDRARVDPAIVPLVKAAAMVERNGTDYAIYLNNVFSDDPDFRRAADNWAVEEVQHGDALGRWAMLADPAWDYEAAFARYKAGYQLPLDAEASVRGSRTGELIARCMVETGTSSYYTALGRGDRGAGAAAGLPPDRGRRVSAFQAVLRPYAPLSGARAASACSAACASPLGRISESEDDELAFAYHCGNEPEGMPYDARALHRRRTWARAMAFYRFRHIERGMGMVFKSVGLPPRGRLSGLSAKAAWRMMQWRQRRFAARGELPRAA